MTMINRKAIHNVLALSLLCCLLMLTGCGKKRLASGLIEDALYPCRWEELRNGSFVITIEGELPENSQWSVLSNSACFTVEKSGKNEFTVKPLLFGGDVVTLSLREKGIPVEKGVDFNFSFSVDEDLKLTLNHYGFTNLSVDTAAAESGTEVYWRSGAAGSIFLHLSGNDWSTEESEGVLCMGPTPEEGSERMEITALQGSTEGHLKVRSNTTGEIFTFRFAVADGALTVQDYSSEKSGNTQQ